MLEKIMIPEIYLPIIYICIAVILNGICKKLIGTIIKSKQKSLNKNSYNYKKTETFRVLMNNIIKYVIILFLVLAILTVYGVNVTSILAGLGIAGVVASLALQDLAKDIIAGMGIILENQYAMGDTISINGFKGEVVFLGLKTTRIKSWEGEVKILANRNITEVINYSISSSLAIVDVGVGYNEDLDKVEEVLNTLAKDLTKKLPKLKGDVEVLGIDKFSDSALIYRLTVPTVSMEHYGIARQIRKEIILCFEKNNINIPYNQIEVHHGK